jgi:N-acetylmuramoyl-L-alanine amidase-like protein
VNTPLSRRELLRNAVFAAAGLALPISLDSDTERLTKWTGTLRRESPVFRARPFGRQAIRVGELAVGTPYEAFALEAYIKAGGNPSRNEQLALSLTRFDCVTLVESCLAVARVANTPGTPSWERFGHEIERMRYRGGKREGYASRLHYFSEWISDGEKRGLVHDMGAELGGVNDTRPLRFMTEHRSSYPALADENVFREIGEMERSLDNNPRYVVAAERIPAVVDRIESGDVLAFATAIPGIDVSHAAFAYRDAAGVLRVLHAPLSGGAVEVTRTTLPEYVSAIRQATGILVARPLAG